MRLFKLVSRWSAISAILRSLRLIQDLKWPVPWPFLVKCLLFCRGRGLDWAILRQIGSIFLQWLQCWLQLPDTSFVRLCLHLSIFCWILLRSLIPWPVPFWCRWRKGILFYLLLFCRVRWTVWWVWFRVRSRWVVWEWVLFLGCVGWCVVLLLVFVVVV